MWQRFSERARRVILLGQEEAGKMNSAKVGTEHLLLGLVRESEGVAAQILQKMEISLGRVQQEIAASVPTSEEVAGPIELKLTPKARIELKLTPKAKRVLELAADEARRMRHNYIGTEHLLLGLVREEDTVAAKVLHQLGLNLEDARAQVKDYLGPETRADPPVQRFAGERLAAFERVTARSQITFDVTLEAQQMLDRAAGGARILGHQRIDTAHILLAILNLGDPALMADVDVETMRQRVAEYLKSNQF